MALLFVYMHRSHAQNQKNQKHIDINKPFKLFMTNIYETHKKVLNIPDYVFLLTLKHAHCL